MIIQTNQTALEDHPVTKKPFVEPEISNGDDILEATAFFQVLTGGTDVPPDIKL